MTIFTDGGSRGNPGRSACAFVVYDEGNEIYYQSKYLGTNTNNYAEYSGVLLAVNWMVSNNSKSAIFYSDSELMVRQLNGVYKIKNVVIKNLANDIKKIISDNNLIVEFHNILRNKNKRADELVNLELDKPLL